MIAAQEGRGPNLSALEPSLDIAGANLDAPGPNLSAPEPDLDVAKANLSGAGANLIANPVLIDTWSESLKDRGVPMPGPLSVDLRERVIAAYREEKLNREELAKRFRIGEATAARWVARWRRQGDVRPKPRASGPGPLIDDGGLTVLTELLATTPDATLEELIERFAQRTGLRVGRSTMNLARQRTGWTYKKNRSRRQSASGRT